jgi:hypothetical protein
MSGSVCPSHQSIGAVRVGSAIDNVCKFSTASAALVFFIPHFSEYVKGVGDIFGEYFLSV